MDKITTRIKSWAARHLSYGGRLQLMQSVLFGMQNYWSRRFIMPKHVLKKRNQLCSSFFWKRREGSARGARVSRCAICFSKSEGGLGLKDIVSWNQACLMKNMQDIFIKAGPIWIAWLEAYVLKERSILQVPEQQNSSWNWRKLLQLR
ncbi:uncharacterized protein LOC111307662 [Durio zibethinus]|uniref:Uncharacterized protein LOC111307662 n=1 Tax=Durio zibethinus TaxID=66656 RepID=A0A6P6A964_DURZI|nr:uncharacterized protein LOC111307662 [Durio zibethinus]